MALYADKFDIPVVDILLETQDFARAAADLVASPDPALSV